MQRRRRRVSTGSGESNASQLLALSLFLMLLAFFIVLNAISDFEETKITPILQSLEQSFAKEIPVRDNNPSVQQSATKSVGEGSVTDKLEALFSSQIPEYESATNSRTGTMHVRLPYDELYNAVMALGQRSSGDAQTGGGGFEKMEGFFLPSLIALIRTEQAGMAYRMDMILNVGDNPPHVKNNNPQFAESRMEAMAQISQRLQNSGLPPKLQSIGLGSGPRETVDLVFRPHVPFDPTEGGYNE